MTVKSRMQMMMAPEMAECPARTFTRENLRCRRCCVARRSLNCWKPVGAAEMFWFKVTWPCLDVNCASGTQSTNEMRPVFLTKLQSAYYIVFQVKVNAIHARWPVSEPRWRTRVYYSGMEDPQLLNCARLDEQDPLCSQENFVHFRMIMRGSWCCAKGRRLNRSHPPNLPPAAAVRSRKIFSPRKVVSRSRIRACRWLVFHLQS